MSNDDFENIIRLKIEQIEQSEAVDTEVLFRKLESRQGHTRQTKRIQLYRYAAAIVFVAIVTSAFVWLYMQKGSSDTIVGDVKDNISESDTKEHMSGMHENAQQWTCIEEMWVGDDICRDLMIIDNPATAGLFATANINNEHNYN